MVYIIICHNTLHLLDQHKGPVHTPAVIFSTDEIMLQLTGKSIMLTANKEVFVAHPQPDQMSKIK